MLKKLYCNDYNCSQLKEYSLNVSYVKINMLALSSSLINSHLNTY